MTVINTNSKAMFAQNALQVNSRSMANAMQQLSTGKRINAAKDDAAGLAIATRMSADLRGMAMAVKNANDGISMTQTAEGALGEVTNMLQRMRELAVQSATGSMSAANRKQLQAEFDQLVSEIDNVSRTTNFNGIKLLDGTAQGIAIQTGVKENDQVKVDIKSSSSKALGIQGYAIQGNVQSGRVGDISNVEFDDVLINGKAWAVSSYTAGAADASGLASHINDNTGSHGVVATSYNVLKGFLPTVSSFTAGDLEINGASVSASESVEELVNNINRDVADLTAVLEKDGTITLSNNTGKDIVIAGTNPLKAGFSDSGGLDGAGTYTGYVALKTVDGSALSLEVRNSSNGFSGATGALDDLARMGFNEVKGDGTVRGQQVLWFNNTDTGGEFGRMTLDDEVEINGIRLGTSSDGSAAAKASAVNELTNQTGVMASAYTEVIVALNLNDGTIDLSQYDDGTNKTFSINGTVINLTDIYNSNVTGLAATQASNLNDVVTAIESYGVQGVKATATSDGNLRLTSDTGQNITIVDDDDGVGTGTTAGSLVLQYAGPAGGIPVAGTRSNAEEDSFDSTWGGTNGAGDVDFTDGFDITADADFGNGVTFGGRLTLSSSVGAEINIKGDYQSLRKLGLNEMGGSTSSVGGALTIMTQESAGRAITKLDEAIDGVALERANLGAFQNRLTAAIDNLNTTQTNLAESRSRILDADYAATTTELARAQIIQQAATAMLAQANQSAQGVLSLLQ